MNIYSLNEKTHKAKIFTIGMPSVIIKGNRLAIMYDTFEGYSTYHVKRNIGLALLQSTLKIPLKEIKLKNEKNK